MGARSKITPAQVYIIGLVLSIISAVVIYFVLIKPGQEDLDAAKTHLDAATETANKLPNDKKDRVKANEEVAVAQAKWARYDRQFMPNIDQSNLLTGIQQLWHEQVEVLGPKVRHFLNEDQSVQVVQDQITVGAPPSDPNAVAKKAFVYDLGTVSVVGTFDHVLNSAERWNRFDRLVMVDNLTLAGNSPRLVGQYTLRAFEFTHGDKPGAAIPQASAATNGGLGGPGGPGGPGGAYDLAAPAMPGQARPGGPPL